MAAGQTSAPGLEWIIISEDFAMQKRLLPISTKKLQPVCSRQALGHDLSCQASGSRDRKEFLTMQPLIVLVTVFLLLIFPLGWWTALRIALAAMFLLTASAHWGKRREDLVRMVPTVFPRPDLMVTITGICEILGAIGLIIPRVATVAAICLTLLLLAIFPANIRAAQQAITIGGRPATPLLLRTLIQVVFLAATISVIVGARI